MKKIFRLITCFSLCLILMVSACPSSNVTVKAMEDVISVEDIDVGFCEKQADSIEEYQQMLAAFNSESKARMSGEQVYDENYGGAYIDKEGELVVLLVDCSKDKIVDIKEDADNSSLKIEKCEHSFNELLSVISIISDNIISLSSRGINIVEMYEDVYNNCVKIAVENLDEEKEAEIRAIIDSPCMEIYEAETKVVETAGTDIKGGYGITSMDNGATSTIGFCAKRNGVQGFVIAGHAGNFVGETFTYSGTTLGRVSATAYYNNSTADAAFVTKGASVNTTAYINAYTCYYVGDSISDYPVGALVYKYGASSQLTNGHIMSNSYRTQLDTDGDGDIDIVFPSQTTADFKSINGDSGGAVFMVKDVVNGRITCKLLGVQSCIVTNSSTGNFLYSVFSRYDEIVKKLNVEAITM